MDHLPTQQVGAIRAVESGASSYSDMRWGLVPSWWLKPLKDILATFNARAETVAEAHVPLRLQAVALSDTSIGLLRMDWRQRFISAKDGQPMTFAGLWERWKDRETGEVTNSYTMIVLRANEFMGEVHNRMPAVIEPRDRQTWHDFPSTQL